MVRGRLKSTVLIAGIAAATHVLGSTPVLSNPIADFYKGKTMKIVVGSSPGGGYDTYARTTARHLRGYIPGKPNIIVQNRPGAGLHDVLAALYVRGHRIDWSRLLGEQSGEFLLQLLVVCICQTGQRCVLSHVRRGVDGRLALLACQARKQ